MVGVLKKLLVILFFSVYCVCAQLKLKKEAYYTTPQHISYNGYPVEKHRAHTDDGYVLQMHRIPAGRRIARRSEAPSAKGKRAVFIVHGLLGSSSDFVIMGPQRSLAFILADNGYDVWLGNLRGNRYTTHKNLTRDDPRFWEYSFHEHGKLDLPAMIDKILKVTGLQKVLYVGYSMGTTSFFTMMSERPEYNEKIIAFVGMAPAVYLDNVKELATMTLKSVNMPGIMRERGMIALDIHPQMMEMFVGNMCNMRIPQQDICLRVVYLICGEDYGQNDVEIEPIILTRFQPASWRQLEHFGKIAITGVFTTWGGSVDSKVRPYNLTNVKIPVVLLYGEGDQLTEKSQIMRLAGELNNTGVLEGIKPVPWAKFNHLDFAFAKDVGKLLNKPIVLPSLDMLYNKYGPS